MKNELPCNCPIASVCSHNRGPFREVQRPQHSILYVEGEPAKHIYMIRKGSVSLHRASTENRALGRTCALRNDGALVGVEALVSNAYQNSARAETPLRLCVATTARITEWLSECSAASRVLLEAVLKAREQEFLPQSSPDGTSVQRVSNWLLNRTDLSSGRNLTRKLMADMLGMRPETLSRALHSLADQGFIEVGRHDVLIVDSEGLRNTLKSF